MNNSKNRQQKKKKLIWHKDWYFAIKSTSSRRFLRKYAVFILNGRFNWKPDFFCTLHHFLHTERFTIWFDSFWFSKIFEFQSHFSNANTNRSQSTKLIAVGLKSTNIKNRRESTWWTQKLRMICLEEIKCVKFWGTKTQQVNFMRLFPPADKFIVNILSTTKWQNHGISLNLHSKTTNSEIQNKTLTNFLQEHYKARINSFDAKEKNVSSNLKKVNYLHQLRQKFRSFSFDRKI